MERKGWAGVGGWVGGGGRRQLQWVERVDARVKGEGRGGGDTASKTNITIGLFRPRQTGGMCRRCDSWGWRLAPPAKVQQAFVTSHAASTGCFYSS